MTRTVNLPDRLVGELGQHVAVRLQTSRAAHNGYRAELSRLDENVDELPRVRMDEARNKARGTALPLMTNDTPAFRAALDRAARTLGYALDTRRDERPDVGVSVRYLAHRASFLHPITVEPSSSAADLRRLANETERTAFARRVSRMNAAERVADVQRILNDRTRWDEGPTLAMLAEHEIAAEFLTGDDRANVRRAVLSAWGHIGENWLELREMRTAIDDAERGLEELEVRERAVRLSTNEPRISYFDARARQAA